jgi:hypothetical protein
MKDHHPAEAPVANCYTCGRAKHDGACGDDPQWATASMCDKLLSRAVRAEYEVAALRAEVERLSGELRSANQDLREQSNTIARVRALADEWSCLANAPRGERTGCEIMVERRLDRCASELLAALEGSNG